MLPRANAWTVATVSIAAALEVLAGISNAAAATADEVRAKCRAEGRPCVGLVLSGGGARGFAHVGVLKVLEELGVKIDVVTGTSMGSMIGGAYAAGYTPEEIEGIVVGVDWNKMLASRTDRANLPWREKENDYQGLSSGSVEINARGELKLPEAIVPSQELSLFLTTWTGRVDMVNDLARLSIPFAAPATDLVHGRRVVMQKDCTLGEAMRASMSVPGAFAPLEYKGTLLVDGGLVDNLPVGLAREMGADVIIAVNVGTPLSGRDKLTNVVGVMTQMVNLLTEQNVRASIESLHEGDILITPDLESEHLTSADLKKSRQIIEIGRQAALAAAERLKTYGAPEAEYAAWENKRRRPIVETADANHHTLSAIRVDRRTSLDPERVVAAADLPLYEPLSRERIEEGTRRIWSEGYYSRVNYRFEPGPNGTEVLVLEPHEKRDRYSTIRIGGSLETDFNESHNFTAVFSHTWHLLNDWGAAWKNEVQLGDEQYFRSEFYQPIGTTSNWFVMPSLEYSREKYDVYHNGKAMATDRSAMFDARVLVGYEIERLGYAGVQGGYLEQHERRIVGPDFDSGQSEIDTNSPYAGGVFFIDTLDSVDFPTSGVRIGFQGYLTEGDEADAESDYYYLGDFCWPISWNRWTVTTNLTVGRSTMRGTFRLGGAKKMIGADYGRWVGSRMEYGRFTVSRNVSDWTGMNVPFWLGVSTEAGRAWNPKDDERFESGRDDWHKSASIFAGLDSPLGPVYLMLGKTFDEGTALYFVWGHRN